MLSLPLLKKAGRKWLKELMGLDKDREIAHQLSLWGKQIQRKENECTLLPTDNRLEQWEL